MASRRDNLAAICYVPLVILLSPPVSLSQFCPGRPYVWTYCCLVHPMALQAKVPKEQAREVQGPMVVVCADWLAAISHFLFCVVLFLSLWFPRALYVLLVKAGTHRTMLLPLSSSDGSYPPISPDELLLLGSRNL